MHSANFIVASGEMANRIMTRPERDDEKVKRQRRREVLLRQTDKALAEIRKKKREAPDIKALQDADLHDASKTSNSSRDPDADRQDASKTSNSSPDPDADPQESLTLPDSLVESPDPDADPQDSLTLPDSLVESQCV